jgi:hypothetical protein
LVLFTKKGDGPTQEVEDNGSYTETESIGTPGAHDGGCQPKGGYLHGGMGRKRSNETLVERTETPRPVNEVSEKTEGGRWREHKGERE